jgi:hypothetical protein
MHRFGRKDLPLSYVFGHPSMNQFFDNQAKPQADEPIKMSYGQKVFDMVKGINVKFGKKKKVEAEGTKTRKKRKRDNMEEEEGQPVKPAVPFKK